MNFPSMNFPSLFVEFVFECTIRATLLVAGAATVLWVLRVRHAATKHRVWTAVLLLMLVLPAWTAWGPKVPIRVLRQVSPSSAGEFVALQPAVPVTTPELRHAAPGEPLPLPFMPVGEQILVCAYLAGFWGLLMRLAIGTRAANRLVRRAVEQDGRRSSGACAAPVTVGWLRPVVILPESWREWPREQLSTVLAHEKEHVRRRDPLVQWIALFNRAVWWFHPAAWWLESELSALAEESCDASVLAGGHDASRYAETLIEMARSVTRAGARVKLVGMAMPGGSLQKRIRQIMENAPAPRISRTRIACVAAACAITCAAFAAGRLDRAQARTDQSEAVPQWQIDAGGKMEFDVASVKPDTTTLTFETLSSNVPLSAGDAFNQTGGLFRTVNHRVLDYIAFAYKLTSTQFSSLLNSLPNLPKWIDTKQYDIEARAAGNPTKDQYRLMMQALLAKRFKLSIHHETKQMQIFALVLDKPSKLGPHLRQHPADRPCTTSFTVPNGFIKPPTIAGGFPESCGSITVWHEGGLFHEGGRNMDLQLVASQMSYEYHGIDRLVLDRTGLKGKYDYIMEFTQSHDGPPGVEDSGPTFLEALKDQLGLKLVPQTGPVDVVVIDHIEEPSPN